MALMADGHRDGFATVTNYLLVSDVDAAIAFYGEAFGAQERVRLLGKDGQPMHVELKLGNTVLMLSGAGPAPAQAETAAAPSVFLCLYVPDVDATMQCALAAGGSEVRPVADQFYGDRSGMLRDPFGFTWSIATCNEQPSAETMQARMTAMMG